MAYTSFSTLVVSNPEKPEARELTLTFIDDDVCWDTYMALKRKGFKVEQNPGYKLFRKVEDAVESAEIFLR